MNLDLYLSKIQQETIKIFHKDKQPLLISGNPGCGKTTLALELLKDTILFKIDTELLKKYKDMKDFILNIVKKRNITLMFKNKNETRGILIDDIHIYHKYDKSSYRSIIEFIKDKKFYGTKIILICNTSFLKNKEIIKIKLNHLSLEYNYSSYYKICLSILKQKNIILSSSEQDHIIYNPSLNFHQFMTNLSLFNSQSNCQTDTKDDFITIKDITKTLLTKSYLIKDIIRICGSDENIIGLNLLENSIHFIEDKFIRKVYQRIYEYYVYSDIIETFMITNHIWELREYTTISICMMNYMITKYNNHTSNDIIYNRYISKSLANTASSNSYNINFPFHFTIFYILFTYHELRNTKYNELIDYLYQSYPKEIIKYNKGFKLFYKEEINLKVFQKKRQLVKPFLFP